MITIDADDDIPIFTWRVDGRGEPGHDSQSARRGSAMAYFTLAARVIGIDCDDDPL
jgi:hypothetical protein